MLSGLEYRKNKRYIHLKLKVPNCHSTRLSIELARKLVNVACSDPNIGQSGSNAVAAELAVLSRWASIF